MVTGQCAHGGYQFEGGNHVCLRCLGDVHTQCVFPRRLCGCVGLECEGEAKAVMTFRIDMFVSDLFSSRLLMCNVIMKGRCLLKRIRNRTVEVPRQNEEQ